MMSCKNQSCSRFWILFKLLRLMIICYAVLPASSSCPSECGGIQIPTPFGTRKGCYLEKSYKIKCSSTTSSRKQAPFLFVNGQEVEVLKISHPTQGPYYTYYYSNTSTYLRGVPNLSFGLVRVKIAITSAGCSSGRKESTESIMNLTGSPFFITDINSLIAVGCNAKVSLTHIEPNMVGCKLTCNRSKHQLSQSLPFLDKTGCSSNSLSYKNADCTENKPEEPACDGNRCCQVSLPNVPQQIIGIKVESIGGNSRTTREEDCVVAFITDEVYTLSNATEPRQLFGKGYATLNLGWVIQTKNHFFLSSLHCQNRKEYQHGTSSAKSKMKCTCDETTISNISYAHCGCKNGYIGNPYIPHDCKDEDECKTEPSLCKDEGQTCVNTEGTFRCDPDKKKTILIGVGAGCGVLALVGGVWWLRKFLIKRRITKRKKKFFQRNGGLLLQQELNTSQGNVEKTRIFSSRELEKATENFSEN